MCESDPYDLPTQTEDGEKGFPLQNKDVFKTLSVSKQNVGDGNAGYCLLQTYFCQINSRELMCVAINFLFFFQRYTRTFSVGGGTGGMTATREGNGARGKMEE